MYQPLIYWIFIVTFWEVFHDIFRDIFRDDFRDISKVYWIAPLDHFVADGGDVVAARHHLLGYAEDRLDVAARARRVHHLR